MLLSKVRSDEQEERLQPGSEQKLVSMVISAGRQSQNQNPSGPSVSAGAELHINPVIRKPQITRRRRCQARFIQQSSRPIRNRSNINLSIYSWNRKPPFRSSPQSHLIPNRSAIRRLTRRDEQKLRAESCVFFLQDIPVVDKITELNTHSENI